MKIDGLLFIKMVDLSMAMLNNQMVNLGNMGEHRKLGLLRAVYRAKKHVCLPCKMYNIQLGSILNNAFLVGGFNPSEKNKSQSVGIIIPNIWKNKTCSKPPTSKGMLTHCRSPILGNHYIIYIKLVAHVTK